MGDQYWLCFLASPERVAVNIVSGSDTMPTVGPLRSLRGGPPTSIGCFTLYPGRNLKDKAMMRGKGRGGASNEGAWKEQTLLEAKRSRDDEGEKLGPPQLECDV